MKGWVDRWNDGWMDRWIGGKKLQDELMDSCTRLGR